MKTIMTICLCVSLTLLAACDSQNANQRIVGQLESDRIEITAEVSEPIIERPVIEGQEVKAGTLLIRQDTARIESRIAEAKAAEACTDCSAECTKCENKSAEHKTKNIVETAAEAFAADVVLKVDPPSPAEAEMMREGAVVLGLLQPYKAFDSVRALRDGGLREGMRVLDLGCGTGMLACACAPARRGAAGPDRFRRQIGRAHV